MASSPSPAGGGILIALGAMLGTVVGLSQGQVVPGFLIGIAIGIVGATVLWWTGRARP